MSTSYTSPTSRSNILSIVPGDDTLDPLVRMLRESLRRGRLASLPQLIVQARQKASSISTDERVSVTLLAESAIASRAMGLLNDADELLQQAMISLPAASLDLLATIKREQVRLLLDRGDLRNAIVLAGEIDSYEFVRVQGAEPLTQRNEEQLAAETWALIAEIALCDYRYDEALSAMQKAGDRLKRDHEERLQRYGSGDETVASFDPRFKRETQQAEDVSQMTRILDALHSLGTNDGSARTSVVELQQRLSAVQPPNIPMLARLEAILGVWIPSGQQDPPLGINIYEATRWAELSTLGRSLQRRPLDQPNAPAPVAEAADDQNLAPVEPAEEQLTVRSLVTALSQVFSHQLNNPALVSPSNEPHVRSDFAIGAIFSACDLTSILQAVESSNFTGYFHLLWDGKSLAEMIEQGRIDPSASHGCGWIFLRDGLITDATTGTFDLPPEEALSSEYALRALGVMIQIGVGFAGAETSGGKAFGYRDKKIQTRPARLEIRDNRSYLLRLVTAIEGHVDTPEEEGFADSDFDAAFSPAAPQTAAEIPTAGVPDTIDAAQVADDVLALFNAITSARDRHELVSVLVHGQEVAGAGAAFARIASGERYLAEAHTRGWTHVDRTAAEENTTSIDVGGGLIIQIGSSSLLPANLLSPYLNTASQRLKTMPLAYESSACITSSAGPGVIVESLQMRKVYDRVAALAPHDGLGNRELIHILITGETGVGKELVARRIHELSQRAAGTWRGENLSGLAKDLVRSAIFGHTKGSFSGADSDQPGLLQQTEGGTLLLDEFGEFDLSTQALVLRMLETKEYTRIGDKQGPRPLKTRIIFATNRQVNDETVFRPDVLYRCKVINVLPLREHPDDIRPLAIHFSGLQNCTISEAALAWCEGQPWPGNIRQLRSVIEEASVHAGLVGNVIELDGIVVAATQYASTDRVPATGMLSLAPGETLPEALKRIERQLITDAIASAGGGGGTQKRAAAILGLPKSSFQDKLQRHNISVQ